MSGHETGPTATHALEEALYGVDLDEVHPGTVKDFEAQQASDTAKQGNRRVVALKRLYDLERKHGTEKLAPAQRVLHTGALDEAERHLDAVGG